MLTEYSIISNTLWLRQKTMPTKPKQSKPKQCIKQNNRTVDAFSIEFGLIKLFDRAVIVRRNAHQTFFCFAAH